jgi:hypothetical protein
MISRTTQSWPEYENWLVVFPRQGDHDYFLVAEKNENGSVTFWNYTAWGAMGEEGKLKPEAETKPVTRKKERDRVDHTKRMIQKGVERSQMMYDLIKANREAPNA